MVLLGDLKDSASRTLREDNMLQFHKILRLARCATPHLPSQSWGKGNEQTRERTKHHAHLSTKNWNRLMCFVSYPPITHTHTHQEAKAPGLVRL